MNSGTRTEAHVPLMSLCLMDVLERNVLVIYLSAVAIGYHLWLSLYHLMLLLLSRLCLLLRLRLRRWSRCCIESVVGDRRSLLCLLLNRSWLLGRLLLIMYIRIDTSELSIARTKDLEPPLPCAISDLLAGASGGDLDLEPTEIPHARGIRIILLHRILDCVPCYARLVLARIEFPWELSTRVALDDEPHVRLRIAVVEELRLLGHEVVSLHLVYLNDGSSDALHVSRLGRIGIVPALRIVVEIKDAHDVLLSV